MSNKPKIKKLVVEYTAADVEIMIADGRYVFP